MSIVNIPGNIQCGLQLIYVTFATYNTMCRSPDVIFLKGISIDTIE